MSRLADKSFKLEEANKENKQSSHIPTQLLNYIISWLNNCLKKKNGTLLKNYLFIYNKCILKSSVQNNSNCTSVVFVPIENMKTNFTVIQLHDTYFKYK